MHCNIYNKKQKAISALVAATISATTAMTITPCIHHVKSRPLWPRIRLRTREL